MAKWNITWNRDASQDIVSTDDTLYTTTSTVEVGTKLYNAEGIDTGKTVSQVNQDGSFEVASSTITLTVGFCTDGGGSEGVPNTTTINGNSITVPEKGDGTIDVAVNPNESCTIVITTNSNSHAGWIYINGTRVIEDYNTITYTFTPTEDCTVGVGRSYEKG